MPSMPVFFWNDADGSRYRKAYFDKYPGVWCHGDWITITDRGFGCGAWPFGCHLEPDGCPDGQRRDLQRGRIAAPRSPTAWWSVSRRTTAATGCRCSSTSPTTPNWTTSCVDKITAAIRKGASPRHVPDDILDVPGIPRTMTGKRLEIPIKRILLGAKPADVVSSSAVDKPDLLAVFAEHARA